jgi:hypothetical protein
MEKIFVTAVFNIDLIHLILYYISEINNIFECPAPKASKLKQKFKSRNTHKMVAS